MNWEIMIMNFLSKIFDCVDFAWFKFGRVLDQIAFRTFKKYNIIKIRSLAPDYCDKDTQMLHGMMQLVVDFVEIEMAAYKIDQMRGVKPFLFRHLPWFMRSSEWIRSREFGVMRLSEECEVVDDYVHEEIVTNQANAAKTIMKIYLWWKDVYPNRQTPEDASGWSTFCKDWRTYLSQQNDVRGQDDMSELLGEKIEEHRQCLDLCMDIELKYIEEETEMLSELVRVRGYLWT